MPFLLAGQHCTRPEVPESRPLLRTLSLPPVNEGSLHWAPFRAPHQGDALGRAGLLSQ